MEIIEKIFIDIIKRYNGTDLKYAIQKDIDLAQLMKQYAGYLINIGRVFAKFYQSQSYQLNVENILLYLSEKRPDLYNVIMSEPKGYDWLNTQIKNIKNLFFK
jgi:hypothetical protein